MRKKMGRLILGALSIAFILGMVAIIIRHKQPSSIITAPPTAVGLKDNSTSNLLGGPRIEKLLTEKQNYDRQVQEAETDSGKTAAVVASSRISREIETLQVTHQHVIEGGQEDMQNRFLYQAALVFQGYNSQHPEGAYFCSGSFIDAQWIVTAAHCLKAWNFQQANEFVVLAGSEDIRQASPLEVKDFFLHEQFADFEGILINDIALIRLKEPAPTTNTITLIDSPSEQEILQNTTKALISGWGNTAPSETSTDKLLFTDVDIVPLNTCNGTQPYNGRLTDNVVCAGATNHSPCLGDSGGPLVLSDGQHAFLEGITSSGGFCASFGLYTIFTRIPQYIDWIKSERATHP